MRKKRVIYSKAPIKEAIIDFRVVPDADVSAESFIQLIKPLQEEFPTVEEMHTGEIRFQIRKKDPIETETDQEQTGYRFTSANKQFVLQTRVDGFTLSMMSPYDRWENFRDKALELWKIYASSSRAVSINRIAVRYINQLNLPSSRIELEDYLQTFPQVSKNLSCHDINGLFMQLSIPQTDIDSMLILNQASVPTVDKNVVSIYLDVDLFQDRFHNPWPITDPSVWDFLELLHIRKNEIFEGCITDKTRELFK